MRPGHASDKRLLPSWVINARTLSTYSIGVYLFRTTRGVGKNMYGLSDICVAHRNGLPHLKTL